MMAIKARTILLAIGLCYLPVCATADDATSIANVQRQQAAIAAQSMLGYRPVTASDRGDCCCPSTAVSRHAYSTLDQQIAALSAALKETPPRAELSPATLAEGAY